MYQERTEPLTSEDILIIKSRKTTNHRLWATIFIIIVILTGLYSYAYDSWAIVSIVSVIVLFSFLYMKTMSKHEDIIDLGTKIIVSGIVKEINRVDYGPNADGNPRCYIGFGENMEICIDGNCDNKYDFIKIGAHLEISFVEITRPHPHTINKYRGENIILGIKELHDKND